VGGAGGGGRPPQCKNVCVCVCVCVCMFVYIYIGGGEKCASICMYPLSAKISVGQGGEGGEGREGGAREIWLGQGKEFIYLFMYLLYLFHVEVTLALGLGDFGLQFLLADLGEADQGKGDIRDWVRERKIRIYIVWRPGCSMPLFLLP